MSQVAAADGHKRSRKPRTTPVWVPKSDGAHASGRMKSCRKKKGLVFLSFKGMGCTSNLMHPSSPGSICSAAEREAKGGSKRNGRQKTNKGHRDPANVAVDVPDVCCAPPGIVFSSHLPTRIRNIPVPTHDRHSREAARRTGNGRRDDDCFAEEILEMMMSQQTLFSGRSLIHAHLRTPDDEAGVWLERSFGRRQLSNLNSITRVSSSLRELDPYHKWRMDVDQMSYEELLDLGDRIGYVGTGLHKEEIPGCLKIKWRFDDETAAPLPLNDDQIYWKCSICQENYERGNEIGVLGCGHHHHVDCINQWLLKKNSCPICKSEALDRKPR